LSVDRGSILQDSAVVVPRPIADGNVKLPFDIVVTHLRLRAHPGLPTMFQSVRIIFASWGFRCWPDASCLFNQHDISSVPGVSIISEACGSDVDSLSNA
jgi:hypothetical protein